MLSHKINRQFISQDLFCVKIKIKGVSRKFQTIFNIPDDQSKRNYHIPKGQITFNTEMYLFRAS